MFIGISPKSQLQKLFSSFFSGISALHLLMLPSLKSEGPCGFQKLRTTNANSFSEIIWKCTHFSKFHPFRPLNPTQDHIPVITLTTTSDRHPLTTTAEAAFPKFYYGINVLKNHYYELYTEIVRSYTNLRSAGLRAGVWVP